MATASSSFKPVASAPALADNGSPSSAAVDATDTAVPRVTPPYNLEGKFVPDREKPYVILVWTSDNPRSILAEYNIYRVKAGPSSEVAPSLGKPYASTKKTEFEDYKLELGETYRYWVTAVEKRSGAESDPSKALEVETMNVTPPSIPTGLAAFAIDPGVSIDWNANPERDIVGYRLYVSKAPGSELYPLLEKPVAGNHYYDKGGSDYLYYWVSAVNKLGLESKVAMVLPTATKPVVYQESDPSVVPDGTWKVENYVGPADGKILVAGDAGSTLRFSFTGSQVKMTVAMYWSCGSARVYIDGKLVTTINEFSEATTYNVVGLNVPGLVHGNHTLTIEVLGSGNPSYPYSFFNVDSFEVR